VPSPAAWRPRTTSPSSPTCAADHVSWRNQFPAGESLDDGVRVRRFPVARERALDRYGEITERAFDASAAEALEEAWFRENGPDAPQLLEYLGQHGAEFDCVLLWAFRYASTYFGVNAVPSGKARVGTCADRRERSGNPIRRDRASVHTAVGFVFLTPEERALVAAHCPAPLAPSCVIGTGLERVSTSRAESEPFLLYLGRVDPNKGCETLLRHYMRWCEQSDARVPLVLAGPANMPIPEHPSIRFLGYVDDARRDALLASASVLVVPSPYESLSIVLLEAWNRGTRRWSMADATSCAARRCARTAALYYRTYDEFAHAAETLLRNPETRRQLGQNGLAYVEREYRWPTVMGTLEKFLAAL
jgi:glycosyltransferase involved in cell wall biosynthesis